MRAPKRHSRNRQSVDLDELARKLPEHLQTFPDDITDPRPHWEEVRKWIKQAAPGGIGGDMTPFLVAVGLDAATFYEQACNTPTYHPRARKEIPMIG